MTTLQLTQAELLNLKFAISESASYWHNLLMGTYDGSVTHLTTKDCQLLYKERVAMVDSLNNLIQTAD